ncbi:MAG TPA: hypothetical protein VG296_31940 [Actinospica sp.]|nr:hypothetical protein [Actinospica sp.]HWG28769.1 hypothetical protein [Actinospica sp.]
MDQPEATTTLEYPFANPTALDPPPEWSALRGRCPVARVTLPGGDEASLLTRYADVKTALSDPRFTRLLSASGAARISTDEPLPLGW